MATRKQAKAERLKLQQQTEEELRQMAQKEEAKTVTVPLDDKVTKALDALEEEMERAFPGTKPSRAALARIAILRSVPTQTST